ncbi:hypothetical protein EDC56_3255 [Sinobacterium caligoides]|uniref:Uncharacterized protein n=1 Tax=Sinobacterium caligoides TaxID=933926 RepID=A0A3N2DGV2_9GAMM|nr:hypothetical protein EDC56_3255 [Sinobacterium caligoides]
MDYGLTLDLESLHMRAAPASRTMPAKQWPQAE